MIIALYSFSRYFAKNSVLSNNEPCMTRPTLIDLTPVELNHYPSMIIPDKYNESCNSVDDLSTKICLKIYINVFIMITRINKAKALTKHISCDCKCKFHSTTCNSDQKWNDETCHCGCKSYPTCKNNYSWNPSTCICEKSKYLKVIIDGSVIFCDEILNAGDISSKNVANTIPTNITNTISTNAMSTVAINSDNKKVRHKTDCYILHMFLLVILLLFKVAIIYYHCIRNRLKQKRIGTLTI